MTPEPERLFPASPSLHLEIWDSLLFFQVSLQGPKKHRCHPHTLTWGLLCPRLSGMMLDTEVTCLPRISARTRGQIIALSAGVGMF